MLRFSKNDFNAGNARSTHLIRQAREYSLNAEYDTAITFTRAALAIATDERNKCIMRNDLACNLINYATQLTHPDSPQRDFEKADSIIKEGLEIFIQNKENLKRYVEGVDACESESRESISIFFMWYTENLFQRSDNLLELGNIEESLVSYRLGLSKLQEALDIIVEGISLGTKLQQAIIESFIFCFKHLKNINDLNGIANLCKQVLTKPLNDQYKKELGDMVGIKIFNCMTILLYKESLNEGTAAVPIDISNFEDKDLKAWEKVSVDPEPYSVKANTISILIKAYDIAITTSIKKDFSDNILSILRELIVTYLNKTICTDISENITNIIRITSEQKWSADIKDNLAKIFINSGCVFYGDGSFKDASNFFRYALILIKDDECKTYAQLNLIKSLGCLANQSMEKAFTNLQDESLIKRNEYISEAANALKQASNVKTIEQTEGDALKHEVKKSAKNLAIHWVRLIYKTQDLDGIEKIQKFITEVFRTEILDAEFCKYIYSPLVSLANKFLGTKDYDKADKALDQILKIPINEKVHVEIAGYLMSSFLEAGNNLCKNNEFLKGLNLLLTCIKILQSLSEDDINITQLKGAFAKDIALWWHKSLAEIKQDNIDDIINLYHKAIMIGGKEVKEQFELQRIELAVELELPQDSELEDLIKALEESKLGGEDNSDEGVVSI